MLLPAFSARAGAWRLLAAAAGQADATAGARYGDVALLSAVSTCLALGAVTIESSSTWPPKRPGAGRGQLLELLHRPGCPQRATVTAAAARRRERTARDRCQPGRPQTRFR